MQMCTDLSILAKQGETLGLEVERIDSCSEILLSSVDKSLFESAEALCL